MNRFRLLLFSAAAFNLALAVVSGLFPEDFFRWLQAPPPSGVPWSAMAAVIGAFGLLYLAAALFPRAADVLVAIGLCSKVLGPLAWIASVARQQSSPRLFPFVVVGDLLWVFPFLAFLLRLNPHRRWVLAWIGVAVHLLAGVLLLAARGGVESEPHLSARQAWIADHATLWSATWLAWAAASLSLGCLCGVWTARLLELGAKPSAALVACGAVWLGVAFDLAGESTLAAVASRGDLSVAQFAEAYRRYQWLSPVVANGLYCAGGLALSLLSWRVKFLRGPAGAWGAAMWIVGAVLSFAAAAQHVGLMTLAGAGVMLLFVPWSAWLGWKLRQAPTPSA